MTFRPGNTDLAQLAAELLIAFGDTPPVGYLPGKTTFRDFVMKKQDCTALEADQVVDALMEHGFLRYQLTISSQIDALQPWDIETKPIT